MGGEKELGASLNLQWNNLKDVFLNVQPKFQFRDSSQS